VELLLIPGKCATCDRLLLFFCQQSIQNRQWQWTLFARRFSSWSFLGFRLLRSLGTTQRYSRTLTAVVPSLLSAISLLFLLSLCSGNFRKIDTHSQWSSRSLTRWSNVLVASISSVLSNLLALLLCYLYGAPANRFNRLRTLRLCLVLSFLFVASLRLWAKRLASAIGRD